jgi:hypothetical protein
MKLSSVLVENYNAAPFHSAKVTFAKEILRDIQQMKMHLHKGHWLLSKGHHRDISDRHHVNNNDTELSLSSVAIAKWAKYWGVLWCCGLNAIPTVFSSLIFIWKNELCLLRFHLTAC